MLGAPGLPGLLVRLLAEVVPEVPPEPSLLLPPTEVPPVPEKLSLLRLATLKLALSTVLGAIGDLGELVP